MSLFPRAFDNDPFFSGTGFPPSMFGRDPFENMFGVPRQPASLTDGRPTHGSGQRNESQQLMLRDPFQSMMMFPFGGGGLMSPFGSMFQNMERMMQQAASDPNAHSFSSSTVMHYSSNGAEGGQPRVYQASTSTRQAPGGIRETRKAVHDSESGTRKMAIGHHIGERSHVIEKRHNLKTQEKEEHQEFVNLDEDEANVFDREWKQKTSTFNSRYHPSSLQDGRRHQVRGLPAAGSDTRRSHAGEKRKHRPPSLVHDDNEGDVQYVRLEHPAPAATSDACASHSRVRATSFDGRDGGSSIRRPRVGEEASSSSSQHLRHHQQQRRHPPSDHNQTFVGLSTRHNQAATMRGHRHRPVLDPEPEQHFSSVSAPGGRHRQQLQPEHELYGVKGAHQLQQSRVEAEGHQLDPSRSRRHYGRDGSSSKRRKQKNVQFQ